jgi:tripartite-type tricarboxylate transporter receptor subunit TctC
MIAKHAILFAVVMIGACTVKPIIPAIAQTYPTRPVRIIVGFAAGGGTDFTARLMGQWLSERLGQPFIIENRPGADSNIATEVVVNARPDGYTLLMAGSFNVVNTAIYDRLNFTFHRDVAPVASVIHTPNTIGVNPSMPIRTLAEFIAYAKSNPGKLNMGSGGVGSSQHVAGELFKMMAGVNLVHVPYRGGAPALADLLGGQLQVMFDVMIESMPYIRAGRLRPLAVTAAKRFEALPDIPTASEFVPGYEAGGWWGVVAPRNTPASVIDRLNNEINAALADPKIKARFGEFGATVLPGTPADFGKLIVEDTDNGERWCGQQISRPSERTSFRNFRSTP